MRVLQILQHPLLNPNIDFLYSAAVSAAVVPSASVSAFSTMTALSAMIFATLFKMAERFTYPVP